MDVAAQLFQRFFLGLVGQVGQHRNRQALMVVHAVGVVGKLAHLSARLHPGCTTGRHPAKARRGKAQHAADDAQHVVGGVHNVVRARHQDAAALSSRHHNVTQSSRRNSAQPDEAAQRPQPEDHRKGDAHSQQGAACAMAFLGADTDTFHRGRLRFCKDLPEPAGHPGGIGIRSTFAERLLCIPVGITSAPLPEGLCGLSDTVVGCMDSGLAHIPRPVADVHAPALKAVGKGIGHGVAKGAQLVFQLLLHLSAFVISVIVFTIVHQNFLTLLPVHTG